MCSGRRVDREIAQRLFVTRKTGRSALTHAYRKLGIHSRDQLGRALAVSSSADNRLRVS